jgi:hypothetical protein
MHVLADIFPERETDAVLEYFEPLLFSLPLKIKLE